MRNGLECALDCVARGWPVLPGAQPIKGGYLDPVLGAIRDSLALCPSDMATTDPDTVRRWWPIMPDGQTRSVLLATGWDLVAAMTTMQQAEKVVSDDAFKAAPTPVVVLEEVKLPVFLLSSARGLKAHQLLPFGATIPLPPAVVEDHETWWLSPMEECASLMSGEQFASLLEGR